MRYYDLKRHWTRRIEPHLADPKLNAILVRDFNKFTTGNWGKRFTRGQFPRDFESCDWDWQHRGPEPRYWRYVRHSACHWLVNFNLRLAQLVEPNRPWRIVTSDEHSTDAIIESERTKFPMQRFVARRYAEAALDACHAEEILEALKSVHADILKLREDWKRGLFSEHDKCAGVRSNRNVYIKWTINIEVLLREFLAKLDGKSSGGAV